MTPDPDNALHEAVRQALADYQPAAQPGWERLRARLRRRRWSRVAGLVGLILLLIGLTVWVKEGTDAVQETVFSEKTSAVPTKTPRWISPAPTCTPGREAFVAVRRKKKIKPVAVAQQARPPRLFAERIEKLPGKPVQPVAMNLPLDRPVEAPKPWEQDIIQQVLSGNFGDDSTSFRALARNQSRWRNAVLVCDATTSMYPYVTQLLAWFRKNERNQSVKGLVLFTDCDSLGRQTDGASTPGTTPGKFFVSRRRDVPTLLPLLLAAARNTTANLDRDENVAEALLFAQRQFPDAQTLVLVADGRSGIKDAARLPGLTKPVAVIQCGAPDEPELAFQPDYWQLVQQTHGSLHTLEDDLKNLDRLPENTWVRVGKQYFRFRRGRFVPSKFVQRPEKLLFFWTGRKQ